MFKSSPTEEIAEIVDASAIDAFLAIVAILPSTSIIVVLAFVFTFILAVEVVIRPSTPPELPTIFVPCIVVPSSFLVVTSIFDNCFAALFTLSLRKKDLREAEE